MKVYSFHVAGFRRTIESAPGGKKRFVSLKSSFRSMSNLLSEGILTFSSIDMLFFSEDWNVGEINPPAQYYMVGNVDFVPFLFVV
jgi:hypothetical protein